MIPLALQITLYVNLAIIVVHSAPPRFQQAVQHATLRQFITEPLLYHLANASVTQAGTMTE